MATTFLTQAPQPGDGAWLLQQSGRKRGRGRKKVESFLLSPDEHEHDDLSGSQGQGPKESFSHTYEIGKERTSSKLAPDRLVPRTIATERLLSRGPQPQQSESPTQLQLHSFLRDLTKNNDSTLDLASDDTMPALAIPKGLPPHLRAKYKLPPPPPPPAADDQTSEKKDSKADSTEAAHEPRPQPQETAHPKEAPCLIGKGTKAVQSALSDQGKTLSIQEKLANHGVKVAQPKPVVSYPSSSEQGASHRTSPPQSRGPGRGGRGGDGARGGRGQGGRGDRGGRRGGCDAAFRRLLPRESRWPTTAETRADPHRYDITWDEPNLVSSNTTDSARASAGFGDGKKKRVQDGIDEETGFLLTDWDGKWAPAPVDWDARPAFRDNQSAELIEDWMSKTDEELCGKQWSVQVDPVTITDGTKFYFATMQEGLPLMGDLAPRYWIPVVIGKQAPQTFWNELVRSSEPKPLDEEDLSGVKPWWEMYQVQGGSFLKQMEHPPITGISPDESTNDRIARENDYGSNTHTENRKRTEKAKRDAQRERRRKAQEKVRKISESTPAPQRIKPGLNIFIRCAKPVDVPRIREIYNHYVDFSVCTPETVRRTDSDMLKRYNAIRGNRLPFLVACERGGKVPGRRKKNMGEDLILPDKIVGFAMADDYKHPDSIYRFTAEMEVYTDSSHYMKNIGKCLVDKLMGLLDPDYIERAGYDIEGEEVDGIGAQRVIENVIVNLPYHRPEHLEWMSRWLTEWLGFQRTGHLVGVGKKDEKSVNLAIFQRKTGAKVDVPRKTYYW